METKERLVVATIGMLGGIVLGLLFSLESNFSTKYHLNLNCTGKNIKLLIPTSEVIQFEKVLNGSSTVTNLEIVIKGQKPIPMGP